MAASLLPQVRAFLLLGAVEVPSDFRVRHQFAAAAIAEPVTGIFELLSAQLADRYRTERELGAGGMATVYLAHDLRDDRHVGDQGAEPGARRRHWRRAIPRRDPHDRTPPAPAHPPAVRLGEVDSFLFYVMPYVEGGSLRDRLAREGQLAIGDAVRIAGEVASALEYAHRQGVIHRDIKPENVLFHDGRALVADFGIALAASETRSGRMTATGMSLGTPQYMSPEQATGEREIDARSDVYALGAVVYEMLVGEPPFTGMTSRAIVAKVLTDEPKPPRDLRKSIPVHVQDAVLIALEKLPADRFATAAAFADSLGSADGSSGANRPARVERTARQSIPTPAGTGKFRRWALWFGAPLLALVAVATGWMLHAATRGAPAPAPVRMAFTLGVPGVDRSFLEMSPDGRRIIQVVSDSNGVDRIMMRDLGSTQLVAIPGSEGAVDPVFSLDGEWISFNADGKLRKVPARGGPPVDVADSASLGGGAWTPDGSIIFTRDGRGLWSVPSIGGKPRQITTLDTSRKEFNHWYPQILPGGGAVIYTAYATPIARASIEAFDLKTRRKTVLVEGAVFGRYAASGHLLYVRDGAIFAVPFDPVALRILGTPVPVQDDVAWVATDGLGAFAVASNGTLAYLDESEWNVQRRVVWADRTGREQPALPDHGQLRSWRLGATLFSALGALALGIAAVGLFAGVSYLVTQRTQEIGVRLVLGGTGMLVARLIVRDALRMAVARAAVGVLMAMAGAPFVQAMMFQTSAREPTSVIAAAVILLGVTVVAAAFPAWRASQLSPMTVLRTDT